MEPRVFTIVLEGNWDGMTPVVRTRDDLAADAQGRNYRLELTGPAGVLTGDFFQVFSAATPKIVGIASAFYNPQDVAAVFRDDPILAVRQQINITPLVHYVVMMPGDKLAIATKDSGRSMITLVVNELTEGDAIQAAFRCPPEEQWRRFRILRSDGQGFSPTGAAWEPEFRPARLGELDRSSLDVTRAREELGFVAGTSLVEGARVTLDALRAG